MSKGHFQGRKRRKKKKEKMRIKCIFKGERRNENEKIE